MENRIIKFKAWDIKDKKFLHSDRLNNPNKVPVNYDADTFSLKNNELVTYCQFTGIKDKNGKEIYEYDICRVTYYNHSYPDSIFIQVVGFEQGTFTLKCKEENLDEFRTNCALYHCHAPNKIEVIGNIFENPELINNSYGK